MRKFRQSSFSLRKQSFLRAVELVLVSTLLGWGCNDFMTKDVFIGATAVDSGGAIDDPTGSPEDSDADGLSSELEDSFGLEPLQADSDQDGYSDGVEFVGNGGDPADGSVIPNPFNRTRILETEDAVQSDPDSDLDGLGDAFETANGMDSSDPDIDDDGYNDGFELVANSNPFDSSDRPERDAPPAPDGIDRLPPGPRDADGDGLSDDVETANGTLLTRRDSDGDGFSDAIEFLTGADPTDFLSIPNLNVPEPPNTTN
ncbi:MAG: hypothetical protein KDD69_06955 [Bdellovibrionales bacterium]|nr:hypothetical protein [Bdellovibrionales bacterium]